MHDDPTTPNGDPLNSEVARYRPDGDAEQADLDRVAEMLKNESDPWARSSPLHVTGSALIVHPVSGRVLLRWHQRQQAWLQVGGHGDPGESDPLAVAMREAEEETGLHDLQPWPTRELRHVVIVSVPPGKGEPAHEHADLRYVLATNTPDAIVAESDSAPLRWLELPDAVEQTSEANLRETLDRVRQLLAGTAATPG